MNLTRRNILKAFGIGAIASVLPSKLWADTGQKFIDFSRGTLSHVKTWIVYRVNDLPAPINGVITLETGTDYKIMETIDLGDLNLEAYNCSFTGFQEGPMFTCNTKPEIDIRDCDIFTKDYLLSNIKAIGHV